MDIVRTLEVKRSILEDNDADAKVLQQELNQQGIFYINLMSSPGSGKTTFLTQVIQKDPERKFGVMEADIDSDVDAQTIQNLGVDAIQLHTGGMCHLDADMSRQGFKAFQTKSEIVFLENVGNLVCPAEYDTGAHCKMMILSVTEGDDKPTKYPLMFSCVDCVIINKMDTIEYFDFNLQHCIDEIHRLNPNAKIFPVSSKTGEGMEEVVSWIEQRYEDWRKTL